MAKAAAKARGAKTPAKKRKAKSATTASKSKRTVASKAGPKAGAEKAKVEAPRRHLEAPPSLNWQVENRIFPRNLTARASYPVPGNPVVSRPEDAVANCYPGLELDVRNFDRRFFPGLVFNFVQAADTPVPGKRYGAVLAYVDQIEDPDLQPGQPETEDLYKEMKREFGFDREVAIALYDELVGDQGGALSEGEWYLEWITQKKKKLSMNGLGGLAVWRLVRGLEPGLVTIRLRRHHDKNAKSKKASRGKSGRQ